MADHSLLQVSSSSQSVATPGVRPELPQRKFVCSTGAGSGSSSQGSPHQHGATSGSSGTSCDAGSTGAGSSSFASALAAVPARVPATPLPQGKFLRSVPATPMPAATLHSGATVQSTASGELRQQCQESLHDEEAEGLLFTPRARPRHYQMGTPLGSPTGVRPLAPLPPLPNQTTYSTPLCSALSSHTSAPPLSQTWVCSLSPRFLQGTLPCSVKLTGSVRLVGNKIITLPAAGAPTKLSPFAPATANTVPEVPAIFQRELSFADLLAVPQASSGTASSGTATAESARRPLPTRRVAGSMVGVAEEMALSPRKRARPRKSHAPARAASGDEQPGHPFEGQGSDGARAPQAGAAHNNDIATPCKAARHM